MSDHDSNIDSAFLDMITNCVGILIILVMVVGQRAQEAPALLLAEKRNEEIAAAKSAAAAVVSDVEQLRARVAVAQAELQGRTAERDDVSTFVAAAELTLQERRGELSQRSRGRFDLVRELAQAKDDLARLEDEKHRAERSFVPVNVKIENRPTPLSKEVDGDSVSFYLSQGRIVFVPMEALKDRMLVMLREQTSKLDKPPEVIEVREPVGGFCMRAELAWSRSGGMISVMVATAELIPTSTRLGEPASEALGPRSKFRDRIEMLSPRQYTIAIWVHPDSFGEYQQIKTELYRLGYSVAAWPLPEGSRITLADPSRGGRKSSAQ